MNQQKSQVNIILGTRPEAIKLAPVIQAFGQAKSVDVEVILTGQHREMVEQVMQLFDLKADKDLEIMQAGQSLTDITERSLRGLEKLFRQNKPDFVIVQGDTTTAFAATLAASPYWPQTVADTASRRDHRHQEDWHGSRA